MKLSHTRIARMGHTALLGFSAAIIASTAMIVLAPSARAEEVVKSYTVGGRAQVRVDTNDGSVNVVTTPDTKTVEFHVMYQGYELNKDLHVDSHQDGDRVELTARL